MGQLLGLELYLVALIEPMWMLADFILVYQTAKTSHKKLSELVEEDDDLERDGDDWLEELNEVVSKTNSFTYPMAEKESLSQISLQFNKGQTMGLWVEQEQERQVWSVNFYVNTHLGKGRLPLMGSPLHTM